MAGRRVALYGQNQATDGHGWLKSVLRMGQLARGRGWQVVTVGEDAQAAIPAGGLKRLLCRLVNAEVDLILTEANGQAVAICRPQDVAAGQPARRDQPETATRSLHQGGSEQADPKRRIFAKCAEGMSIRDIAGQLNAEEGASK